MSPRSRRASWTSSAICSARAALAAAALACVAPACATAPWQIESDGAEADYAAAVEGVATDPDRAAARLEAFLRDWPSAERADDAALELARVRAARGDVDGAVAVLANAIRRHPRGDRVDEARLLLARLERQRGRLDEARRAASAIRPARIPEAERFEAYRLLAEAAAARSDVRGELRWLGAAFAEAATPVERLAALREVEALLARLAPADLDAAERELREPALAALVRLHRAELALSAGQPDVARRELEVLDPTLLSPEVAARREELYGRLRAAEAAVAPAAEVPAFEDAARVELPATLSAEGTLGVVLPLTGPFARYGEASLRGVMLAAGIFGAGDGGGSRVRLLVRDSRGDPATTAAAVAELAADPAVQAIVGPLRAESAEAAAPAAEAGGIALLALTAREQLAGAGEHVFRLGLTARSEAEALAEYAATTLGVRRIAILHPRDAFGRGLKDLFWQAAEARGATIAGIASYDPQATDFAEPIRRLTGHLLQSESERAALRERERLLALAKRSTPEEVATLRERAAAITGPDGGRLPPIVDFDALYIADTHQKAELIAPQLAFHEVEGVRLLGPSGWNHPDLVAVGGRHVEGAVFTEGFFAESRFAFVANFRDRYRSGFDEEPDALAAQAFDAANLVLLQLAQGLRGRDQIRDGLRAVRGYPGASGVVSIGPDGNAQRRPFLLGVRGGQVVALD
jgi:ABC-type branched-subunit amino acid transport system substrate-binding protein